MSEQGKAPEFLFYSDANELNYHQAIEHCHKLQKENEALKAKIEKCKEALEFYGEPMNWWGMYKDRTDTIFKSDLEMLYGDTLHGGKRARAALKEIEGMK